MDTPNNSAGKLTENIMGRIKEKMPAMPTEQYNPIYSAVYDGLSEADKIGLILVPDNDYAFMAIVSAWPRPKKRRFYKAIKVLFD